MNWSVTDAVDYKGRPADRSRTGGWIPAALSLGMAPITLHIRLTGLSYIFYS